MDNTVLLILIVAAVAFGVWWLMAPAKKEHRRHHHVPRGDHGTQGSSRREGYSDVANMDSSYEVMGDAEDPVSSEHFADMVNTGDQARYMEQPRRRTETPHERLEKLQSRNLQAAMATHVPQYNIDAANPAMHAFSMRSPHVTLRSRLADQADPIRGDIPIRYSPEIPMISGSQYGRESQRMDGLFSDYYVDQYNTLTGRGYLNTPVQVMNEGTIMDYRG